jgi:hypothetical protein
MDGKSTLVIELRLRHCSDELFPGTSCRTHLNSRDIIDDPFLHVESRRFGCTRRRTDEGDIKVGKENIEALVQPYVAPDS